MRMISWLVALSEALSVLSPAPLSSVLVSTYFKGLHMLCMHLQFWGGEIWPAACTGHTCVVFNVALSIVVVRDLRLCISHIWYKTSRKPICIVRGKRHCYHTRIGTARSSCGGRDRCGHRAIGWCHQFLVSGLPPVSICGIKWLGVT